MNVLAFSTSAVATWRWRIVDYNSQVVEESSATFSTIADAVAAGTERLKEQDDRQRRRPGWPHRR